MPTPYTHVAGILIIVSPNQSSVSFAPIANRFDAPSLLQTRLYEEMQRWDCAQFWRKKLGGPIRRDKDGVRGQWRALGEQAFEQQDFVFAADFYAQSLASEGEDGEGVASAQTTYRYLFSLTQFTGPCDATQRQQRQLAAWRLAQRFRCDRSLYGDAHYWRLRELYARCFPPIYRVVFEWDEVFAQRIARWWKAHCSSSEDAGVNAFDNEDAARDTSIQQQGDVNQASPRKEGEVRKKTKRRRQRGAETPSAASATEMPSRARLLQRSLSKRSSPSRRDTRDDKRVTRSANNMEANDTSGATVASSGHEGGRVSRARRPPAARSSTSKPTPNYYEASPTKRKFSAVRYVKRSALIGWCVLNYDSLSTSRRVGGCTSIV